jgi:hypothetical protein
MLFALDYDGTYTADPLLWDSFIITARAKGHRVFVVTMRSPEEGAELEQRFGRNVDRIVYTSREGKRACLERNGHQVSVWIDNHPEFIVADAVERPLPERSFARWRDHFIERMRELLQIRPVDAPAGPVVSAEEPVAAVPASEPPEAAQSSRLATVYGFKIWSATQGRYRISKYKAPRDILARYDVVLMEETEEVVPRSELDKRGRYLRPEMQASEWSYRTSSFDLQSGLEVIEEQRGAPRP